jgi:asparagine synthetase B (glutamine-hydrolysing)
MCSIIGSYDINKIEELAELNRYRGEHSHSLFVICPETYTIKYSHKGLGSLNVVEHNIPSGYMIVHQQAPTGIQKEDSIHPAVLDGHYLWHNGIIKNDCVKELQKKYNGDWDTLLLLYNLIENGKPNNIDGSFSCLWYNKKDIIVFRNEISPLFMDTDMNISSTEFNNCYTIPDNTMLRIHLKNKQTSIVGNFKTIENPYFFAC